MGVPVVIAGNGMGIAVKAVESGAPVMTVAADGFGMPIVMSDDGAPFIVEGAGPDNLLDGLPWIQGSNTTMSTAGGLVRATTTIGNPRVYKTVTGLTNGATYRLGGTFYKRTMATSIRLRVSPTPDLPDGSIYEFIEGGASHTFTTETFVMSGTTMSIGMVGVSSNTGEYAEIDEDFRLEAV